MGRAPPTPFQAREFASRKASPRLALGCQIDTREISPSFSHTSAHENPLLTQGDIKNLLNLLNQQAIPAAFATFTRLLQACGSLNALSEGQRVHSHLCRRGLEKNPFLANYLMGMYGKCGSLEDALMIFNNIHRPNVVSWTAMISIYCQQGYWKGALHCFQQMKPEGVEANKITFATVLTACASLEALGEGRAVHAHLTERGLESDIVVGNALLSMYGKSGSLIDVQRLFQKMEQRDVISWTAMIMALAQKGQVKDALQAFRLMHKDGVKPNEVTFVSILSVCTSITDIKEGMGIHSLIVQCRLESQNAIGNALVTMYGKHGKVDDALGTFHTICQPSVSNWTAIIAVYVQNGHCKLAIQLFSRMQQKGVTPNKITLITVLNACAVPGALTDGEVIHSCIADYGFESDVVVGNALINMYSKCGSLEYAKRTFDNMLQRDVVSWTTIIIAYSEYGMYNEAFELFQAMQNAGLNPDKITFVGSLSACTDPSALAIGRSIHAQVLLSEFESDVVLGNALISMYGKCGSIMDAEVTFGYMHERNTITWNCMIALYGSPENGNRAYQVFQKMQLEGVVPDKISFVNILSTLTSKALLAQGKIIHTMVVGSALESDFAVGNALVSMYAKFGDVMDSRKVFTKLHQVDVVTWTVMITAYAQLGQSTEALHLFYEMQAKGVKPDKITLSIVLNVCSGPESLEDGRNIHASIIENGFESDVVVENDLINMYGACGSISDARKAFDIMLHRDVVSWNAMTAVYCDYLQVKEAFQLFKQMLQEDVKPDEVSFVNLLSACASVADLEVGNMVHAIIVESRFGLDNAVGNALVNMYSKCGSVEDAWKTFDNLTDRDIVSWTTMIAAYAQHGRAKKALEVFQQMEHDCVNPNDVSFVSVLSACNHAGLVDQGLACFHSMKADHGIMPRAGHHSCMIDLLARVGQLDEAEEFTNKMPGQPGIVEWMALLSACKNYGDVERGRRMAGHLIELDPECTAAYVVLAGTYASADMPAVRFWEK